MLLHAESLVGHGIPAIFLHGLLGDGSNLRKLAGLCSLAATPVLMDMRNHGRSPHAGDMAWPVLAADVLETADRLGLSAFHLVGHSLGGKLAMAVAELAPKRVVSLSVLDIAPAAYTPGHQQVFAALQDVHEIPPASREEASRRMSGWLDDPLEIGFLMKNLARTASGVLQLRCDFPAIRAAYAGLCDSPVGGVVAYRGPVLFLKGEHSSYINQDKAVLARQLYPQSRLFTIHGAGHWLHFEQADMVAEEIIRFWAQVKA